MSFLSSSNSYILSNRLTSAHMAALNEDETTNDDDENEPILGNLTQQRILKQCSQDRYKKTFEIDINKYTTEYFKNIRKTHICIIINGDNGGVSNGKQWKFEAQLWILKASKPKYYYKFQYSKQQLKQIQSRIKERELKGKKYFASQSYPKKNKQILKTRENIIIDTKTGKLLKEDLDFEEKTLQPPKLPNQSSFFKRSATNDDAINNIEYLNHLMTSYSLCSEEWFWKALNFDPQIIKYLCYTAKQRLEIWIKKANEQFTSPLKLANMVTEIDKFGKAINDCTFYAFHVVKRPLNPRRGVPLVSHWALKLEGYKYLLTVEFFEYNRKHGIVQVRLLPNSPLNRRIFWYWWEIDPGENHVVHQYFTQRWQRIDSGFIEGDITGELLGRLIIKWIRTHKNKIYHMVKNNCQHFVRDLVAFLDVKMANQLNIFLDDTLITDALPAGASVNRLAQKARVKDIRSILKKEEQRYKKDIRNRKKNRFGKNKNDNNGDNKDSKSDDDNDNDDGSGMNINDNNLGFQRLSLCGNDPDIISMIDIDFDAFRDHTDYDNQNQDQEQEPNNTDNKPNVNMDELKSDVIIIKNDNFGGNHGINNENNDSNNSDDGISSLHVLNDIKEEEEPKRKMKMSFGQKITPLHVPPSISDVNSQGSNISAQVVEVHHYIRKPKNNETVQDLLTKPHDVIITESVLPIDRSIKRSISLHDTTTVNDSQIVHYDFNDDISDDSDNDSHNDNVDEIPETDINNDNISDNVPPLINKTNTKSIASNVSINKSRKLTLSEQVEQDKLEEMQDIQIRHPIQPSIFTTSSFNNEINTTKLHGIGSDSQTVNDNVTTLSNFDATTNTNTDISDENNDLNTMKVSKHNANIIDNVITI